MGRWIILAGFILIAIGAVVQFAPWLVSWFGRLPGDVRVESGRSRIFIPITSMIVVSAVLTLLVNLVARIVSHLSKGAP
jgi:hypothetical protein